MAATASNQGTPSSGLTYAGPYGSSVSYSPNSWVTYKGSSYLALTSSVGVLPVAAPGSATAWVVMAQAGSDGNPGIAGPQGPAGIQGMQGVEGVAGPSGAQGIQGNPGKTPTPLDGLHWMPWGDSITAKLGGAYQAAVVANTGITIPLQDARGGRRTDQIFENYSNDPVNGVSLGGVGIGNDGNCFQDPPANLIPCNQPGPWSKGHMLTQDLAGIDVVTIFLGTNDLGAASSNLGSMSSTAGDGSYYGTIMAAIEGFLRAKPGIRLIWVTPYQNALMSAKSSPVVSAIKDVCGFYSVPVLDLYTTSGITPLTFSAYLDGDKVHLSAAGSALVGRKLSVFMTQRY